MRTMKLNLAVIGMLAAVVASQGADYVSANASGSTVASATFVGVPAKPLTMLQVDVTSDKAASVITWRAGDGATALAMASAADTATNLYVGSTAIASNDVVLIQSGTSLAEKTVWGTFATTGTTVTWQQPLATNMVVGDPIYQKYASTYVLKLATNVAASTNLHVATTNGFAAGDFVYCAGKVAEVYSVAATNIALVSALNVGTSTNDRVVRCVFQGTNLLAVAVGGTSGTISRTNAQGLAYGADLVLVPTQGPVMEADVVSTAPQNISRIALTAATGQTVAAGDVVYATSAKTTPVGAATLRLSGPAVFVCPPGRPAKLSLDGTSAVKLNNIVGLYQ